MLILISRLGRIVQIQKVTHLFIILHLNSFFNFNLGPKSDIQLQSLCYVPLSNPGTKRIDVFASIVTCDASEQKKLVE